jgi:CheY-like chemotaxis protein/nitrogen-specific signal transduction histidine kinase
VARTGSKQKVGVKKKFRPRRGHRRAASAKARKAGDPALAAFAHDIRTSLTGILALGELLASSNIGERERHWAAAIKTGAEHLSALTALIVDSAKAHAGALILQQEVFQPRRLIEALAASLDARAQTKGLQAEVTVADDLPDLLVGDQVRLRAALENLLDNAVKFTAQGAVRLDVRGTPARAGRVKITVQVSDSGIGLKRAEIKRLFRPYAQASADVARRYGGAGLGLAVVKRLAKLMGGDLTVTSMAGRGASFCFTAVLPLAAVEAPAARAKRIVAPSARRLSVLCVEDNPYGRVILNTILAELGHHADFVGSGEEALATLPRGYDLILMDVTLPGIGGLDAARRIRAFPGAAGTTPIIGISGGSEADDEAAAHAAGMNFYLRKPISPSALNKAIATVVPG